MADNKKPEDGMVQYKDTLNLPRTDFPIRASASIDDPIMIARWEQEKLYDKAFVKNEGKKKFILHDGPPYANANIHLGTSYNKILKDIVTKSERMTGKHVPVTPGWDCHGLPIELRVTAENPNVVGPELKEKCRAYASHWIGVQKQEFKQLGVVMDWNHPYETMSPDYEAATVQAFGRFVAEGYISRKNKTVPWCASCKTVLAAAEIERYDRKDPSIYVRFPLVNHPSSTAQSGEALAQRDLVLNNPFPGIDREVSLLVWTTTPWTLPLNRAVFLKANADYQLLDINGHAVVVGTALVDKVCDLLKVPKVVLGSCKAQDLAGRTARHPFIKDATVPVCADVQFVELTDGTACVHCAPGCGPEDYEMGIKNNLEIFSPLSPDGCYTAGIQPEELEGMSIKDALGWVMTKLQESNTLLFKTSINHAYPHCWRCRNGLMFRATKQWFCELDHKGLQDKSLEAIETIQFLPEAMRNHLRSAVSGRLEWCLSRQRTWGTPIIALICTECDKEVVDQALLAKVVAGIAKDGIEYWDRVQLADLIASSMKCSDCGSHSFRKEKDILDVWFDSGVSHYAVLAKNKQLGYPADMYLEGIDQHRGWFQSSLLTSMALEGKPCFKTIVTHGYTVDDKGRKMSKSLGNVTAPQELIDRMGTDGLRLWVASIEMQGDVVVSNTLLTNIQESYRKIRNTCRFFLQNLYDYDHGKDALAYDELLAIDQYALHQLALFSEQVQSAYQKRNLTGVFHALVDYCTGELSSFYMDIIKDRLYTDQADGRSRRSAQTACWIILDTMTRLMAPILSFTAEQISDHYQKNKKDSIHLQDFAHVPVIWGQIEHEHQWTNIRFHGPKVAANAFAVVDRAKKEVQWEMLREMRSSILKAIELLRQKNVVKHSLEAKVTLTMNTSIEPMALIKELLVDIEKTGQSRSDFLKEFCIVSACDIIEVDDSSEYEEEDDDGTVYLLDGMDGLVVKASRAPGSKCPRCWQWEVTDHEHGLCNRCQKVVSTLQSTRA